MADINDYIFTCSVCDETMSNNEDYYPKAVMSRCDACGFDFCYDCLKTIEGFEDITSPNPFYINFDDKTDEHHRECPKCAGKLNKITSDDIYSYGKFMMRKNGIETLSQLKAAMAEKKA